MARGMAIGRRNSAALYTDVRETPPLPNPKLIKAGLGVGRTADKAQMHGEAGELARQVADNLGV